MRSTTPERARGLPGCAPGGACHPSRHAGRAKLRQDSRYSGQLVRRAAVGAGDVTASHANHEAPATVFAAKDVHYTQEAVTTPHALPPPSGSSGVILESLQAELAAAWWAWLGPTLLVRAYDVSEHADNDGLTPGQRRKPSVELAGKRATLAETGAWIDLLRLYVRDLLSREVFDARGDGTHTLQQSTTLKADTMRASDKMDSCNIRALLYKFSRPTHAHRRTYEPLLRCTHRLLLRTDEHEIVRIKTHCADSRPLQRSW